MLFMNVYLFHLRTIVITFILTHFLTMHYSFYNAQVTFPYTIESEKNVKYQPLDNGTVVSQPGWNWTNFFIEIDFPFSIPQFESGPVMLAVFSIPDIGIQLLFLNSEGDIGDVLIPYNMLLKDIKNYDSNKESIVRYDIQGEIGQRVFILEFFKVGFENLVGTIGATVNTSFQISIFEDTGELKIHFGEQNNRELFDLIFDRIGSGPRISLSLGLGSSGSGNIPVVSGLLSGNVEAPFIVEYYQSYIPPENLDGLLDDPVEGTLYRFIPTPTNTNNHTINNHFSISPNPASDYLNVFWKDSSLGQVKYSIFSVDGRNIISGTLDEPHHRIETSSLNTGIYIIEVSSESTTQVHNFLKK